MRIYELFTVPEGKKVTEKMFGKVLICSVLSIFLCMVCLISTTWAWFAVSIDNGANEVKIATATPVVEVKNAESAIPASDGVYVLNAGIYTVDIQVDNNATVTDDLNRSRRTVYVIMTVNHDGASASYRFALAGEETRQIQQLRIESGTATVSFCVSWIEPASAAPADGREIVIGQIPTEPATQPETEPVESGPTGTAATEPE